MLLKFKHEVALLKQAKVSNKDIATTLNKPIKSIKNAASWIKHKNSLEDSLIKSKKEYKSTLRLREKRAIKRDIIRSPKKQNSRLLLENNLSISKRTLQRYFKEEGITINVASKKAYINSKNATLRLKYAKTQLKNIKNIDLRKVIFSDESAIQRGHGSRREYYRKLSNIRAGKKMVSVANRSTFKKIPNRLFYAVFYLEFF
jgi:AraC-like DNA-binding protein